ncbi:unnamed protein product [Orchesella dallaii]|uniref:BTB domain-containing protein n=1 Tax=Orchesella dallaii TaxID=48710 RepID=A0ABP1S3Y4_9HEXA
MASDVTRKAYLLKNGEARLQFVGSPPSKNSERALIFTADSDNFICIPDETYDTDQIQFITREIEKATGLDKIKPKIEMYGKYDTFFQTPRIYTDVLFPQEFVKSLSGILPEARIRIKGTYKVLQQLKHFVEPSSPPPLSSTFSASPRSDFGIIHPLILAKRFRSRLFSTSAIRQNHKEPARMETQPRIDPIIFPRLLNRYVFADHNVISWTPFDDQVYAFSVEGLELKENATYEGFQGLEKLAEYYNSHGLTTAKLTYSVILEWKEFEGRNDGFEASTLEKLFDGKPLADCVIKAANGAEFECHRNILGVNSDVFLAMFEVGMSESKTHLIDMKDVSEEGVKMMLDYLYGRNLHLEGRTEGDILEVLKAAHKYNISKLESIIAQFLLYKPMDWFSMDGVLDFYFFVKNVDALCSFADKLKAAIKGNTKKFSASATYQKWMEKEPNAAAQFVLQLFETDEHNVFDVNLVVDISDDD